MTSWDGLKRYFPAQWLAALMRLPPAEADAVQEIRLRVNAPIMLSTPLCERFLCASSASALQQKDTLVCRREQLDTCFLRFCDDSVYAHEAELCRGFLCVPGGIRVGVAGTAVVEGDAVRSVRQITSLCVRLPRAHRGCASLLMPLLMSPDGVQSALLVGEPSSGKTTLLRDVAATLAARGKRVAVVDERGEISGVDGLAVCDVLRGYPKATGIMQAVRCLAPQVVIFDELGDEREQAAVAACAHAGVAVIASLHGSSAPALQNKPAVRRLIEQGTFSQWVFLQGRYAPGVWRECLMPEVVADEVVWHRADYRGGAGNGAVLCPAAVSSRG